MKPRWYQTKAGGFVPTYYLLPESEHYVSITLPNGRVMEFDCKFMPNVQSLYPISEISSVVYTPRPGTYGTLIALAETPWYFDGSMVNYWGDSGWMHWEWTASSDGVYVLEYRVANAYDSIVDSFALFDTAVFVVEVNNVAPSVEAGPNQIVVEGELVSFSGSFTDAGILDTHTLEWDFGDGSPLVTGTLTPTHIYVNDGYYTVTLTVTVT